MFEMITAAPADPILGIVDLFNQDKREQKINLGIGVYKNENGQIPMLNSVKKTEQYLLEHENDKNYLSIAGLADFAKGTQNLLLGSDSPIIAEKRVQTVQTPGGTGALRVAADFLVKYTPARTIWISRPTWPNHQNVFRAAGMEIREYRYYDQQTHTLDFDNMLADLSQAKAGDVILFHGCCHNPTGIDPTLEQWQQLADMSLSNGWLPLFDFAYQGFGHGLNEDAQGLRLFAAKHREMLIASSYSKNFSLYNERVGACSLIAASAENAANAFSQIKTIIRANYSNPPAHGAKVVSAILNNPTLHLLWEQEVTGMRQRIQRMRNLFVNTLKDKGAKYDYSFIAKQNGMFSYSGLNLAQVSRLRDEFAIYIVDSGRINVAAMTLENMTYLCESIIAVEE